MDRDVCAGAAEGQHDRPAEAARPTCDERDASV
jgi:hypothetical protein